jgi:glycerol-3-phosphate dehydrogenase (NAD(P)+)
LSIISIVGAGLMGTALSFPASDNGHEVRLVGTHLDTAIIESCRAQRFHPTLKRTISPAVRPYFHSEIGEALRGAEVIVLGVNSRGVHWAAEAIGPHLRAGQCILMVTKGLETTANGDLMLLPDVLASRLPAAIRHQVHYAAIGGPSIAGELAARRDTSVVFVSRDAGICRGCVIFATPYYHIWTSTDRVGVELCVALKNPYALAVGLVAGLLEAQGGPDSAGAKMHNYAAAIFAQGLAETAALLQAMGGGLETVFSLPGAGDLYVTAQEDQCAYGRLLGLGVPYSAAVEEMPGETIEGIDAVLAITPGVEHLIAQGRLAADAMPLLRALYRIVTRNEKVEIDFNAFFRQTPFAPPKASLSSPG